MSRMISLSLGAIASLALLAGPAHAVDGTLTIGGTAVGMDIDESTGRVDTLGDGMWSGCFTDDTSTDCSAFDANPITGTFTGTRRVPGG